MFGASSKPNGLVAPWGRRFALWPVPPESSGQKLKGVSHFLGSLAVGQRSARSEGIANHSTGDLYGLVKAALQTRYRGKELAPGCRRRPHCPFLAWHSSYSASW